MEHWSICDAIVGSPCDDWVEYACDCHAGDPTYDCETIQLAHEADDEGEVGRLQILAHVANEVCHVRRVLVLKSVVHIVPALEPNEAGQLVAAPVVFGKALLEFLQRHPNLLHHQPIKMAVAFLHLFAILAGLGFADGVE